MDLDSIDSGLDHPSLRLRCRRHFQETASQPFRAPFRSPPVHLSDGIVHPGLVIGGYALAGAIALPVAARLPERELPRLGVASAALFVGSAIAVPFIPGVSIHLVLNGVAGVILGHRAFVAVSVAVTLQAILLYQGGLGTLGLNVCIMGLPAIGAALGFRFWKPGVGGDLVSFLCGGGAVLGSTALLFGILVGSGEELREVGPAVLWMGAPLAVVEGVATVLIVRFLHRVKPDLLRRSE